MTRGELLEAIEAHRDTCNVCQPQALCLVAEAMLKRLTDGVAEAMAPAPKRPAQA